MENPVSIIREFIDNLQPFPSPERELDKFFSSKGLERLSHRQIRKVIEIVIDQARESRRFGLKINRRLLEKEEAFFLIVLNNYGGVEHMVKNRDFNEVSREISEVAGKVFEKEGQEYFEKFKKLQEAGKFSGSNNSYMNHLEITRGAILNSAYGGRIEA